MKCPNCGNEISSGSTFCKECGAPVQINDNNEQPMIENMHPMNNQTIFKDEIYQNNNQKLSKNKSKIPKLIIILIIIIAIYITIKILIIPLIAVPQVTGILNSARESAAIDTAYGVLEAADSYTTQYEINSGKIWNKTVEFTCNGKTCTSKIDGQNVNLNLRGTIPTKGSVQINNEGISSIKETLIINGYKCDMDNIKVKCTK